MAIVNEQYTISNITLSQSNVCCETNMVILYFR